jgi:Tol biopolymer transport system component
MRPQQKNAAIPFLLLIIASFGCSSTSSGVRIAGDASLSFPNETRITNLRQLTYGGTNAEAYWSYDGRWITYQHSGPEDKCDQIYRMSADGKVRNRVSSGLGRTTCSFFTPNDDAILYSSTHAASKDCPPEPDRSKTYAWPIYQTYQFYKAKPNGKDIVPIEPGAPTAYNGELVTCKDGKVIFTSDRNGDLDLYTGKLDRRGMITEVKQITNALGYDGGAFFSPDCSKIVWRAARPTPGKEADEYVALLRQHLIRPGVLEVWTANADGTEARQVTKLGASTFSPYFTPDGKKILFVSNYKHGPRSRNFDIHMIRDNGTELEQITHSGTFDSFPMFSPDGKYLAFSSNRNARKPRETNVFVGDWNARLAGPIMTDDEANPVNRWFVMNRELSSSDMEGRGIGTKGLGRAESYVAELFQKAGVREMGGLFDFGDEVKGFEHEIDIVRGVELNAKETSLKADWRELKTKEEFAPAAFSSQGAIAGKILDVGYGIVAPELGIDDYEGKNVKGRIVLVRRRVAEGLGLSPAQQASYGDLRYKAYLARERGAAGIAFWEPEGDEKIVEDLMTSIKSSNSIVASDAGLPVIFVNRKIAREWLGAPKAVSLSGKIALDNRKITASNIVGVLGSDEACKAGRPVVIGAHLDHLGYGDEGSLESGFNRMIHPGADDNASGVASMIESARFIRQALADKRATGCYVFAAFTAEESGVIGSSRLVDLFRKKGIRPKAMLNLDMVGRLTDNKLAVFGADSAKEWKRIVKSNCERHTLSCDAAGDGYGPSDHMPFYIARVPVLHFFTGAHADYHRSSDTSDKVNPVGGVQIAELVSSVAIEAADRKTAFTYVKASGKSTMGTIQGRMGDGKGFGAFLGTIPNYSQAAPGAKIVGSARLAEAPKGVLLSGVRPGSPAAEGGVREGDVITGAIILDQEPGFAAVQPKTMKIQNLEDYTIVLRGLKPGMRIKLQLWRKGENLELPITIGRRSKKSQS